MRFKKETVHKIIFIIIWLGIMLYDILYLKPKIDEIYFYDDINSFSDSSWGYSLLIFLVFYASMFIWKIFRNNFNWIIAIGGAVYLAFLTLALKNTSDNFILLVNTKFNRMEIDRTYKMSRNGSDDYWVIYDSNRHLINDDNEFKILDNIRKRKGLKSISKYHHNDTIHINYQVGVFGAKYPR